MIKVAIIGCGKQADAHAALIQRLGHCEIVGVCDKEELMARQLHERFRVKNYYSNVHELLERARPDVVHITSPPQSHLALGKLCLENGCHVFFEKPFALNFAEAEILIELAQQNDRKLTVGHNNQFNKSAIQMRDLIRSGFLGGTPIHMESIWGYDLGDPRFARALLGEKTHWVRQLPGKLLHNIISHGVAKIAEFMTGTSLKVMVHGFTSNLLKSTGNTDIVDELRVIIRDGDYTTAYFTFSTQIKPMIRQFRVYGPKNSLIVDDMHETVIRVARTNYKSYLNQLVPPCLYGAQYFDKALENVGKFIKRDLHFESGRRRLVESFYGSISDGTPLPITYKELLLTSRIMDSIFDQIKAV